MLNIAVFLKTDFVRAFCRDSKAYFLIKKKPCIYKDCTFHYLHKKCITFNGNAFEAADEYSGWYKKVSTVRVF